jgi:hypothetical protein
MDGASSEEESKSSHLKSIGHLIAAAMATVVEE